MAFIPPYGKTISYSEKMVNTTIESCELKRTNHGDYLITQSLPHLAELEGDKAII